MAQHFEKTPVTLLSQIQNSEHEAIWERAWADFVAYYVSPVRTQVKREFLRCNWHNIDANVLDEATSTVFLRFLKSQDTFRYDPEKGKLRGYLGKIASWVVRDTIRSHSRNILSRAEEISQHREAIIDEFESLTKEEDEKFRSAILRSLLSDIRKNVSPQTFAIFELINLEGKPTKEVMNMLSVSRNTIDGANHRVIRKLQTIIDSPEYRAQLLA